MGDPALEGRGEGTIDNDAIEEFVTEFNDGKGGKTGGFINVDVVVVIVGEEGKGKGGKIVEIKLGIKGVLPPPTVTPPPAGVPDIT